MIKKTKVKNQKAITLIALVITIIVLLILAGVSIATLTGEKGILTQASNAKKEAEIEEVKEQAKLDIAAWVAEKLANGESASIADDAAVKEIIEEANEDNTNKYYKEITETTIVTENEYEILLSELYTPTKGEPPIPEGFYYAGGTEKTGFVISDKPNDDLENTAGGNQFVWIPVKDISDFIRVEGYYDGDLDSNNWISYSSEPYAEGSELEKSEYQKMYDSVDKNDGFYIGRFETGNEGGTYNIENEKWEGDSKTVVKRNAKVYRGIGWSDSNDMTDETGGVVELSRNFDTENGYTSVTSTLCYGVQWDAALNFIDPNYITNRDENGNPTCEENSYVRNSTGKGNYYDEENTNEWKGEITETGKIEDYAVKNIYDMAGNAFEWTMEVCDDNLRFFRGGTVDFNGAQAPASYRYIDFPSRVYERIGFRIALYLEN